MSADSFDFWLGTWDVRWKDSDGKRQSGTNSITRVNGTIRELFTDAAPAGAYIGASVSTWDAGAECWIQDYWDNRGYTAIFRGSGSADGMTLVRIDGSEKEPLTRLVWTEITSETIRWDYERQGTQGNWESTWRIDYARRQET